jgi:chemotaxis signal transduction protein
LSINLRFRLQDGSYAVPLKRVYRVAAFASLAGEPEDYFVGWLRFQGKWTPVFDLNQVVCESPTPEEIGSRIMLVEAEPGAPVPHIGLLAAGVTDTAAANEEGVTPLDLDLYLQMLSTFIPPFPQVPA